MQQNRINGDLAAFRVYLLADLNGGRQCHTHQLQHLFDNGMQIQGQLFLLTAAGKSQNLLHQILCSLGCLEDLADIFLRRTLLPSILSGHEPHDLCVADDWS